MNQPLPDHSSLTKIRHRYGVEVFRRFFDAIVEQCQQEKLVWGKQLYIDRTQVNTNANLDSLTPRFAVETRAAIQAHLDTLFEDAQQEQPQTAAHQPLTSRPTEGACEVAFAFHIDSGSYGNITLDSLNVAMIARTPGPMAEGNWSVAIYIDERANDQQRQALEAIFSGSAGGPLSALAPLISTVLGAKTVPITFNIAGKRRSVEIPNIMHLSVHPLPSLDPNNEIWALNAHPFSPKLAMAVGDQNSTWTDYGMSWDNSGKNGHYASINWSNA